MRVGFVDEGVSAEAELLSERAPRTCEAFWEQLAEPLEVTGVHAMWTGPEVSLQIPPAEALPRLEDLPPENTTVMPEAGTIVFAYVEPYEFGGNPEPIFDVGIFYGPHGRIFLPIGWFPCNQFAGQEQFARLVGDWDAFRTVCARTRTEGARTLYLERA